MKLLRSDLYRFFKSKAFYFCLLVMVVLIAGSAFLMEWSLSVIESDQSSMIDTSSVSLFKDGISYGVQSISDGSIHLFLAIVTSIFITAEFSYGTMKNIVSKGYSRAKIYLSKLITMAIMTIIMIVVAFASGTIAATIITGQFGTFTWTYLGEVLRVFGIQVLLHTALSSLFVMFAMIIRNNGGTIAFNIIVVSMFGQLLYQLLELIFKNKIMFSNYSLRHNISLYYTNIAPPVEDIVRSILVGITFLTVSTLIGVFAFRNMDIK